MYLTEEDRDEAIEVLRYLEVDEDKLNKVKLYVCDWQYKNDDGFLTLGGRDGWSGLSIDRGPDYEKDTDEDDEEVVVNGVTYKIHEAD